MATSDSRFFCAEETNIAFYPQPGLWLLGAFLTALLVCQEQDLGLNASRRNGSTT